MKQHNEAILITKASGEAEVFKRQKLEHSLLKAGATEAVVKDITKRISEWITPGVTTREIYTYAFTLLKEEEPITPAKYRLKDAFLELGPSGYPFEKIIGELFQRQGYTCETGVTLNGCCITHEMDVIATKGNTQYLMECKYRQEQGKQISIQTPLYVHSRINDIVDQKRSQDAYKHFTFQGWVVTNTRFSKDSELYGKCKGLHLLGWDYPNGNGLKDLVEKHRLYPVSILTKLVPDLARKCLVNGLVTCSQLYDNLSFFKDSGLTNSQLKELVIELEGLLQ